MNKKLLIGIVIVLLLLLGGAGYMFMTSSKPATQSPSSTLMNIEPQTQTNTASKSLKDLMSIGQNQTCTFTDSQSGSSGTMYIGKGDVRGDFQSTINGKTTASHMIVDGVSMYMWMDGQRQGMKFSMQTIAGASPATVQNQASQAVDINSQVDYSCNPWTIDEAMFDMPTSVEFTDYSKMMSPSGAVTSQCAACDSLTGTLQTQCKTALNCD